MNRFLGNIFKTFSSNVVSLLSGILVGFFIPKMMGVIGYANYKISLPANLRLLCPAPFRIIGVSHTEGMTPFNRYYTIISSLSCQ